MRRRTVTARRSHSKKANLSLHEKALINIDKQINQTQRILQKQTKKNVNLYNLAKNTRKMRTLLAELRYLINECKKANECSKKTKSFKRTTGFRSQKKTIKKKNKNRKRIKRAA